MKKLLALVIAILLAMTIVAPTGLAEGSSVTTTAADSGWVSVVNVNAASVMALGFFKSTNPGTYWYAIEVCPGSCDPDPASAFHAAVNGVINTIGVLESTESLGAVSVAKRFDGLNPGTDYEVRFSVIDFSIADPSKILSSNSKFRTDPEQSLGAYLFNLLLEQGGMYEVKLSVDGSVSTLNGFAHRIFFRPSRSIRLIKSDLLGLVFIVPVDASFEGFLNGPLVVTKGMSVHWDRGICDETDRLGGMTSCVFKAGVIAADLEGDFEVRVPSLWLHGSGSGPDPDPQKFFYQIIDELAPAKG